MRAKEDRVFANDSQKKIINALDCFCFLLSIESRFYTTKAGHWHWPCCAAACRPCPKWAARPQTPASPTNSSRLQHAPQRLRADAGLATQPRPVVHSMSAAGQRNCHHCASALRPASKLPLPLRSRQRQQQLLRHHVVAVFVDVAHHLSQCGRLVFPRWFSPAGTGLRAHGQLMPPGCCCWAEGKRSGSGRATAQFSPQLAG